MTTYYIDPTLGSDSNAGTSASVPLATFARAGVLGAWAPGNSLKLRRGRVFTEALVCGANGAAGNPITVTHYGDDYEKPRLRPSANNTNGFDFGGYAGIVLDGLDCKATGDANSIWFSAYQSGSNLLVSTIRNCKVTTDPGSQAAGIQGYVGRGFNPGVIDAWTVNPQGVIIEDNVVEHTSNLGIGFSDYSNVIIRRNTVVGCCIDVEQIGIILSQTMELANVTWTLTSGNVYQTTWTSGQRGNLRGCSYMDTVRLKFTTSDQNWSFREVVGVTPSTITAGQFTFAAGVLYINAGGLNPNTATETFICCAGVRNWIVSDNKVYDTVAKNGNEGVGIQADAFVGYGQMLRNYVRTNNGQPGMAANDARQVKMIGNVVENVTGGLRGGLAFSDSYQGSGDIDISNNTAIVSGVTTDYAAFNFGGTRCGGTFTFNNNIVAGACNTGLVFYSPDSTCTIVARNNCMFGPLSIRTIYNATLTESGNISSNPQLRADYMPMSSAVRTAGTGGGGGDYYGNEFQYTPTIGAVQYEATRTLTTRTVAAGSVATRSLAFKRKITA